MQICDDPFVIGKKRVRIRHDNLPATALAAETATERVRDASVRGVDPADGIGQWPDPDPRYRALAFTCWPAMLVWAAR